MATVSIEQAIAEVKKRNPKFGAYFEDQTTLLEHSRRVFIHEFQPEFLSRQKVYKKYLSDYINKLFANDDDQPIVKLAEDGIIASSTPHHNIFNYPLIVGGHVAIMLDTFQQREEKGDMIILDTSNVPFNEILHKRGVEFQGRHINLFPKKDKRKVVYAYPKYDLSFIQNLKKSKQYYQLQDKEKDFFIRVDEIVKKIDFSTCDGFADQVVKINYKLWPLMYSEDISQSARRTLNLPHDVVLSEYLVNEFLPKSNSQVNFVYRSLFDNNFRQAVLTKFNGLYGCWDRQNNKGTHFFWYLHNGEHRSMWLDGDELVAYDRNNEVARIPLQPEALAQAIKERKIIAGIFVKFSLVAFWLGVKLLGGPGQTSFSNDIKTTWLEILSSQDKKLVNSTSTHGLSIAECLYYRANGKLTKAYGMDACFLQILTKEYINNLKKNTVSQVMLPGLALNYYRLVPVDLRQPMGFSDQDLIQGFDWIE